MDEENEETIIPLYSVSDSWGGPWKENRKNSPELDRIAERFNMEMAKQMEERKCIVKDCKNHRDQGTFIGKLCLPCHEFITTSKGIHSQAFRNSIGIFSQVLRDVADNLEKKFNIP